MFRYNLNFMTMIDQPSTPKELKQEKQRIDQEWVEFFDHFDISYEPVMQVYKLEDGTKFRPDFYLIDRMAFCTIDPPIIKGSVTAKARALAEQSSVPVVRLNSFRASPKLAYEIFYQDGSNHYVYMKDFSKVDVIDTSEWSKQQIIENLEKQYQEQQKNS